MISDLELLGIWEAGFDKSVIEKSLLLVGAVRHDLNAAQIASMAVGQRDAILFDLRKKLFGPLFSNMANCVACGQQVEWEMPVDSIRMHPDSLNEENAAIELEHSGHHFRFRLPNSADLIALSRLDEGSSHEDELLKRCLDYSMLPDKLAEHLPLELKSAILQKMEACDPQADIALRIRCPGCGHEWSMGFDIMRYLWAEVDDWAANMLQDVSLLAGYFGWAEKDILEMGPFRRNAYLNMLNR